MVYKLWSLSYHCVLQADSVIQFIRENIELNTVLGAGDII